MNFREWITLFESVDIYKLLGKPNKYCHQTKQTPLILSRDQKFPAKNDSNASAMKTAVIFSFVVLIVCTVDGKLFLVYKRSRRKNNSRGYFIGFSSFFLFYFFFHLPFHSINHLLFGGSLKQTGKHRSFVSTVRQLVFFYFNIKTFLSYFTHLANKRYVT